ncbi:MAG: transposase, partial [Alphaproteobacteria bacterium]
MTHLPSEARPTIEGAGRRVPAHCGSGKAKRLCAEIGGFSLHAATRCRAGDRFRLARLCRYVMRPAFADDQLSWDGAARVTFELKTPWRDGT